MPISSILHSRRSRRRLIAAGASLAVLGVLTFYPLPYFLKTPGSAEQVKTRVTVADSRWTEKGDFLFTTVFQHVKPGILEYAFVRLTEDYTETVPVEQAIGNVSDVDAYQQLTEWMRVDSEASSVLAAYHYLGKPIQVEQTGVIIRSFLPNAPAAKSLHEGDIIIAADGKPVKTVQDLAGQLKGKKKGDTVLLQIKRGSKTVEANVPVIELDSENGTPRLGIGFYHAQVQKAVPDLPIRFRLDDIGGPSAGLMLSLDIVSKLEQKDYTRGRKIAGTGTIDADGNVGQIGGIRFKLVAASREGAEYFLVPKDMGETDSNQKDAEQFLRSYSTSMKLVPVGTLKEAADFLAALPEQ
ncbi:YlbL family protein [Gorillibacterium sp. sgz5001074]|uniref:YlbL family protein n=1 Tax=Gorillibacterium sp. sgz5001074 TaxID=3446695 RepID=UPI003F66D663